MRAVVAGQPVDTTVDSETAQYYLESYLRGARTGRARDATRDAAFDRLELDLADLDAARDATRRLASEFSPDFATVFLVTRLLGQPYNSAWREAFIGELGRLNAASDVSRLAPPEGSASYLLLGAPGWHYRTKPETGADLALPRAALSRAGIEARLIATEDDAPVEDNATLVAEEVIRQGASGRKLILFSPSKAGAEVAQALGERLTPQQSEPVKAWINIGGLVRGSPLGEFWLDWRRRWLARLLCVAFRWRFESISGMCSVPARAVYRRLAIPGRILVVNYLGAALSGTVTARVRRNYHRLSVYGPNDGLTLLVDAMVDGSVTLTELGLDHYYQDAQMDLKTVALARAVIGHLEGHHSLPEPPQRSNGARRR